MPLESEATYACPSCGETNAIGIDPMGGRRQRYTEDCPVCCRPLSFTLAFDRDGEPIVEAVDLE